MRQPILSPDKFAEWFNSVVPGAYRKLTALDIRDMAECGLIGRYGYYGQSDLQTARAILLYEQLRDERNLNTDTQEIKDIRCKRCGEPLPNKAEVRKGRPREYCAECERFRARERHRMWRLRNKALII